MVLPRRHEIDALRSIALLLLIFYHAFCAFQPFAHDAGFIQPSPQTLEKFWFLGELINLWRIPVLFLIAGLVGGYLLQRRSVKMLLKSRLIRLVPPLIFCSLFLGPLAPALFQIHEQSPPVYRPDPLHLWFVWNLVVYFIFSLPLLLYLKDSRGSRCLRFLKNVSPWAWLIFLPLTLGAITIFLEPQIEAETVPNHYTRFWHGFGCFIWGLILISLGDDFWRGLRRICHLALCLSATLYLMRVTDFDLQLDAGRNGLLFLRLMESSWAMLSFVGYGSLLFSRPWPLFHYLNRAAFALYILHFPIQQAAAFFLVQVDLPAPLAFPVLLAATLISSILIYQWILLPLPGLHPFFGIAPVQPFKAPAPSLPDQSSWLQRAGQFLILYLIAPVIAGVTAFRLVLAMFHNN